MFILIRLPRLPTIHPTPKNVEGFGGISLLREMADNVKYSFEINKLEIVESLEILFNWYLILIMFKMFL